MRAAPLSIQSESLREKNERLSSSKYRLADVTQQNGGSRWDTNVSSLNDQYCIEFAGSSTAYVRVVVTSAKHLFCAHTHTHTHKSRDWIDPFRSR